MIEISSTPLIILAILGTVALAIPLISISRKDRGSSSFYGAIAFGALLASIGYVIYQFVTGNVAQSAIFSEDVLVDDAFGGLFAIAMLIVAIMTTVASFNYMRKHKHPAVYFSLILLSAIGMVFVAYSTDLVMLFVAWELMSIPTYILAGYMKKDPSSNEAALKYFLFGALSSAIIIYGISIAYGITGSTNIGEVIQGFSTLDPTMTPLALLAVRIIIMGAVALSLDWTFALGIIAVMTMTVGNIAAVMQKNLARMLAYSSIGHAGYILIGLSIAPFSAIGIQGSLFHILNHAVMKGAAFIAVAGIVTTLAVTNIDKLKGLARKMPITSLGLVISLLALAGVPPLSGFWSKLMLFGGAIDAGPIAAWAPWLAIAGVLNSALSLAYYGWIIRKMYFEGENEKRVKEPKSIIAVMIFSIIFIVAIGVYPDPIIQFTETAVPNLAALSP